MQNQRVLMRRFNRLHRLATMAYQRGKRAQCVRLRIKARDIDAKIGMYGVEW